MKRKFNLKIGLEGSNFKAAKNLHKTLHLFLDYETGLKIKNVSLTGQKNKKATKK